MAVVFCAATVFLPSSCYMVMVVLHLSLHIFCIPCIQVSGKDDVAVGRIRQDLSQEGNHG